MIQTTEVCSLVLPLSLFLRLPSTVSARCMKSSADSPMLAMLAIFCNELPSGRVPSGEFRKGFKARGKAGDRRWVGGWKRAGVGGPDGVRGVGEGGEVCTGARGEWVGVPEGRARVGEGRVGVCLAG